MNRFSFLLFLFVAQGAAWAEGPKEIPSSSGDLNVSAQDSRGSIWAFSRGSGLQSLKGEHWENVSVPELEGVGRLAFAFAAAPMADGGVAVLWSLEGMAAAITRHEGEMPPRLLATFPCRIPYTAHIPLFCDSRNRLWFTLDREVHRLSGQGEGRWRHWSYTVPGERFYGGSLREFGTNPLALAEDGQGRIWAWGNPLGGAPNFANLAGVLIFDGGEEPAWHRTLGGLDVAAFGTLSRKDENHLWLPVLGKGLFEVETETLKVDPVPAPKEGAFQRVAQVLAAGEAWLVTAGAPDRENWSLWRLKDSRWDCPVPHFASRREMPREYGLATPFGFLVALPGDPAWLLKGDDAVRLDWQAGIPARAVVGLHRLPEGGTMLLDKEQSVVLSDWKPGVRAPALRVAEIKGGTHCVTPDGHLWLANEPDGLKEWDGGRWADHPAPKGLRFPYRIETFARDASGWFWLLSSGGEGPIVCYHPGEKRWLAYKEPDEAFLSRRENPARWPEGEMGEQLPVYSPDGKRIAFIRHRMVRYYDGEKWTDLRLPQLDRETGIPFFDDEGSLRLITETSVLKLTESGKWDSLPATPAEKRTHGLKQRGEPAERLVEDQRSLVIDNRGTCWGTAGEKGLFKARAGRIVFVFSRDEIDPFRGNQEISEAWVDANGNAFLKLARREKGWVRLSPKSPVPRTRIALARLAEDSWEVTLDATTPSKVEFLWQLDGAPQQQTSERKVRFDFLPAGKHRLTVSALDEELQSDATPAVAGWEIKLDADAQLKRTIAALGDPERRTAALAALALQPEKSVPALKQAREESADDDQRWWIDATLQEIERRARKSASP